MLLSIQQSMEDWINWITSISTEILTETVKNVMKFEGGEATFISILASNVTAPAGFVLMVIYFLTSFMQRWKNGNELSIDDIAKPLFFLVATDILLSNVGAVISFILSMSNAAGDQFSQFQGQLEEAIKQDTTLFTGETSKHALADPKEIKPDTSKLSLIGLFPLAFTTLIGFICTCIAAAALYVTLLSAKAEMVLRMVFAPIGLASFADESKKDDAIRYVKKMIASGFYVFGMQACVYYVMWIGILKANSMAKEGDLQTTNGFIKACLGLEATIVQAAVPFSAVGVISVAKSAINDAFT